MGHRAWREWWWEVVSAFDSWFSVMRRVVCSANMRRARRAHLGEAAPRANPRNDQLDRWITIVVWLLVGLGLLLLFVAIVLPLIVGLAD